MQTNHSINSSTPAGAAVERLLDIMAKLRDPQYGCAWDRKQTLRSLTSHTLEEVYEVVEAVETGDAHELQDELGDLLFQIVFYARIASEEGLFDFSGVADSISRKLLRRHPHIFPGGKLDAFGPANPAATLSADQVEVNWEAIKEQERQLKSGSRSGTPVIASVLDDVPRAFPALDRAKKLQKRAASIGFDWPDLPSVIAKLDEESAELKQAIEANAPDEIMHELGDLLFTCVNIARHLRVEPESALREANQRFERRFRYVEEAARTSSGDSKMDLDMLEEFWQRAKSAGL